MTVFQYIDQIKTRLQTLQVASNLDDQSILMYINTARKKIQYDTLAIFPERYGVILEYEVIQSTDEYIPFSNYSNTHNAFQPYIDYYHKPLPLNVIDVVRMALVYTDFSTDPDTFRTYEARRITKKELFGLSMHSTNKPNPYNPVYTLTPSRSLQLPGPTPPVGELSILYSSLRDGDINIPTGVGAAKMLIWATCVIADLEWSSSPTDRVNGDTEIVIAKQLEDLVILYTIYLYLQQINEQNLLKLIGLELGEMISSLQPIYQLEQTKNELQLATQEY